MIGLVIVTLSTMGVFLAIAVPGWLLGLILAEYQIRRLEAVGATVSPTQFPEVYQAAGDVCAQFGPGRHARVDDATAESDLPPDRQA